MSIAAEMVRDPRKGANQVTTKTIANGSSSVYYGPSTPAETLVNNGVILTNPAKTAGSELGDDAITLYETNGITLVNTGTINATYSGTQNNGYGIKFIGTLADRISVTNTATGVIEDTGGYGEPRRVCRRLFCLSHTTMACSSAWA
jgi:hypothetical protein